MRKNFRKSSKFNLTHKLVFGIMAVLVVLAFIGQGYKAVQMDKYNCKPTGQQRLANSVNGVVVEDQYKCDNGKIMWQLK